ncbi:efflux RND transporter periplasmic adaptor subunit [Aliivibrio fischeri]|uniref:efflux RND transporter periplasmic adaptor subunit n=1 Tax=Aliivibrio fischeri TaxID=668 RepID=UPI001F3B554F|nr:efflux RND transporter periplasmic adaptor subunit [Aliivibrio fischeri]MCE7534728.1 efflux RND transporter periplasmic adaptor subunit [Aliivibrio fischeri]MCE7557436.1 efflux RND transporter periplasmic adaptor subunit [Aliivibrio fischeri]
MQRLMKLSLLSSTLLLTACSPAPTETVVEIPNVVIKDINSNGVSDRLYLPAVATAADRSHLSFRLSGEIKELNIKAGEIVKKGQVLAVLDKTDYNIDVDNARARYNVANSQYKRSKPLVDKGLLAKSQFDELAAQRQIALADLELAKLRLSFTELKAPIDGVTSRVSVEQFENIQVGQQIFNINNRDAVDIIVQVPDKLYAKQPNKEIIESIKATVRLDSGESYSARIKEYTTEPDPDSGAYLVTLTMPMPEDQFILDGMAVEVATSESEIRLSTQAGMVIPIEAIFNEDGDTIDLAEKYVWLVGENNTVKKQKVVTTKATSSGLRVVEGLSTGDRIVIAGVSRLRDGMSVNVINAEEKK